MSKNHRQKIKQINNIIIYFMPVDKEFLCVSPDGKYLKGFKEQNNAETFCMQTQDYCGRVCR